MLALIEFIKPSVLLAEDIGRKNIGRNYQPDPLPERTQVYHNGGTWVAIREQPDGWIWLNIGGRNPDANQPILFPFGDAIYSEKRYTFAEPIKLPNKAGMNTPDPAISKNTDTTITIPLEYRSARAAYSHAKYDLESAWPDGEYYIAQDPRWAVAYAVFTGKEFYRAEPIIKTKVEYAVEYAVNFKKRWPEIEPGIKQYPYYVDKYCKAFGLTYDPAKNVFLPPVTKNDPQIKTTF